ncbi:MAG: SurA N-terminal domain-containing protein [Candidatus Omnitrophica bacterium]|nr:SurA N-terminal domain-containing protein [Candidatus Omnitrophota bacterium]
MLKKLRDRRIAKWIWIVVAVLILPAFLLWGVGSMVSSGKEGHGYAGRIFGKNITPAEFKEAYIATRTQFMIQMGDQFSKLEKYLNLKERTWDRLILLHEAQKRKIQVSDAEVRDMLEKYPFFQSKGAFDYETYAKIIQYYFNTQPRVFEEETRGGLAIAKLYDGMTKAVVVSPKDARDEYIKENEQLSVYYIAANTADFNGETTVDDARIKDYFAKNSLQFKKPDSFNLEYLGLEYPPDAQEADTAAVDKKIKDVVEQLNKDKDLAKSAKELSLEIKETGLFGLDQPIPGIGWSPEIIDTISKLSIGSFAPPIHTQKGWYIVKLKEKKDSYVPSFEEAREQVKERLIQEQSRQIAKSKIESALSQLHKAGETVKPADLDKAAKSLDLKSSSTELFKRSAYIQGLGASDKFYDAARKLDKDRISPALESEQGFYIIMVKELVPIDEEKFTKEEKDFTEALLKRKKEDSFAKFIEDLRSKARLQDWTE